MTAQIALLNKKAVVLASDSAITINRKKVFSSNEKIHKLSNIAPVGIMSYGSAEVSGVPVEVIVNEFRELLGVKKLSRLRDYGDEFIKFIGTDNKMFDYNSQVTFYIDGLRKYYLAILDNITREYKKHLRMKSKNKNKEGSVEKEKKGAKEKFHDLAKIIFEKHLKGFQKVKDVYIVPQDVVDDFISKNDNKIDEAIKRSFPDYILGPEAILLLKEIARLFLVKAHPSVRKTGIVIAGFGEDEHFPSYVEYEVHKIINGKVVHRAIKVVAINFEKYAAIIPFADSEVTNIFIAGISLDYKRYLNANLKLLTMRLSTSIMRRVNQLIDDNPNKQELLKFIKSESDRENVLFYSMLKNYEWKKFVVPIISILNGLPTPEMVNLAESLINITSLRKRVSFDMESVGGNVSVVVLTKPDGFVWAKREDPYGREGKSIK